MPTFDKHEAREQFEMFLFRMDDQVEALQDLGAAYHLDLTVESLDRLERFFDVYRKQMPEGLDETDLMIMCARYLGEVLRENYGGIWDLPLDNPKNVNFNRPVVVGARGSTTEFSPIHVMRGYSLRPKPGALRRALESQINPIPLDLSDLAED